MNKLSVLFDGSADDTLTVEFFLIEYGRKGKLEVNHVLLNEEKIIELSEHTKELRFALRVSGHGQMSIDTLDVAGVSLWNTPSVQSRKVEGYHDTNNWYYPDHLVLEEGGFAKKELLANKAAYILYDEPEGNFNILRNGIEVDKDRLAVSFSADQDEDVHLSLSIIFYIGAEKHSVISVDAGELSSIPVPSNVDRYRLAVRVSGSGRFKVNEVTVNNISYWWNSGELTPKPIVNVDSQYKFPLSHETLGGWQQQKSCINYHPHHQMFASNLKGKQFSHLKYEGNDSCMSISPQDRHYYRIKPVGEIYGDVNVSLLVIGYDRNEKSIYDEIPFNSYKDISFDNKIDTVRFIIRVSGSGYFRNLEVNADEYPIKVTKEVLLDNTHDLWYPASPAAVDLSNEQSALKGDIDVPDGKNVYISYKENNNSFGRLPELPVMHVDHTHNYEFFAGISSDEGVTVIPMLVGYSADEKQQVFQLKANAKTIIKPNENVTQFRIALRVSGVGSFALSEFRMQEVEPVGKGDGLHDIDKYEVDQLDLISPKPLKGLKMAVIFDEFTKASYEHEANLITFTPDDWLTVLSKEQPDMLMVESAWNGNGGTWNKKVGYYGEENFQALHGLLEWCKQNNIPTVFWNKEDPVHFNRFIQTAKHFDYIYTTDANMVEHYMEHAGHQDVYALPFAAQPAIHNPISIVDERIDKACFAGSYYRHHEERCVDMDRLLDAASDTGLDIYDRNYHNTKDGKMPNHRFPERFETHIQGNLKYYEIDKAYKGYKVMINVNTVKQSPTMFSRRVFEGLACGTPVISTYAEGIEKIFPDLVEMSEDASKLKHAFKQLLEDEQMYREKSMIGIREALSKHTYTHRLSYITGNAGLNFKFQLPVVDVIAHAESKEAFYEIKSQFERQTYENKKLIVLVDTFDGYLELFNKYNNDEIEVFIGSYMHNYSNIMEWIDSPYITYFAEDDYYGEHYLSDLMLCTLYTSSEFIGKASYFRVSGQELVENQAGNEYRFVSDLCPSRTVMKTEVFSKEPLTDVLTKFKKQEQLTDYFKYGKQFYSSDKFNYVSEGNRLMTEDGYKRIETIEI
ncbi:UNVERIFIED_CONTAM: glycosyltransferase [Halobacillus marinus]